MMNKKWVYIILTVVVLALTAAVIGLQLWFDSSGVHVLAGQVKVQVEATGYIINGSTGEVIGQTPVTVSGKADGDKFDGELLVLGYQNAGEGQITGTSVMERTDSGFYLIHHLESCVHDEEVDGQVQSVEHICDYYYTYYLYPQKSDLLVVCVGEFDESVLYYVVCADSETEALKEYNWFMEHKPD